jgi:hypothetical protein
MKGMEGNIASFCLPNFVMKSTTKSGQHPASLKLTVPSREMLFQIKIRAVLRIKR